MAKKAKKAHGSDCECAVCRKGDLVKEVRNLLAPLDWYEEDYGQGVRSFETMGATVLVGNDVSDADAGWEFYLDDPSNGNVIASGSTLKELRPVIEEFMEAARKEKAGE